MHLLRSRRRRVRSIAVAGAVVLAAIGPVPLAGAADSTGDLDDGMSHERVSELVADLLAGLGVPEDEVDAVVAEVLAGVAGRLNRMVDEGFVTVPQIEERHEGRADVGSPPPEPYPTNAPPAPTAPPPAVSYPDTGPTLGDPPPPPPAAGPTAVMEAPQ
ncbi:MAG: hypothetical protein R8F63_00170 [Acidimicrobiales bacterium]|nr:hypothetical protein [Acidimicrobiales bacterium]